MLKAYFRIIFALLAVAFVGVGVAVLYYFWQNYQEPSRRARKEIAELEQKEVVRIDHGAKVYETAMGLLRQGDAEATRSALAKIIGTYKDSTRYDEARRIIGQQNLDLLLSFEPMAGKSEYTVKRGDNFIAITRDTKSTMEYISQVNNAQSTRLQVGQRLVVCALDAFSVVVNLSATKVELRQNDLFFAEFDLQGFRFPPGTPNSFDTSVKGKSAFAGGKSLTFDDPGFASAEKQIGTARPGIALRPPPVSTGGPEDVYQTGIYLAPEDVEELFIILRTGAKIHVRS